jgi:hypothetical protein
MTFREERQQADSCDVSLTSAPTTIIRATVGRAFILQSFDGAHFPIAIEFFRYPKQCFTHQRACDFSAHRLLAGASIDRSRRVRSPLQTVRPTARPIRCN